MYTLIRDIQFKSIADAMRGMPVAMAVCKYLKEKHSIDIRVLRAVSGSPNSVRFVSEFDSIDAWQAISISAIRDSAYLQLLAEIATMVDGSKTADRCWQAL